MAFDVRFYSFSKRTNSTKVPTGTPETYSCVLKDNTDIINPTLQIRGGSTFNPKYLNYCWIAQFSRYYFINTWRYVPGLWECDCNIDVLATFKPVIEDKEKYILRSSYRYNINLVDTLYPALSWQPNYYYDNANLQFARDMLHGTFIIGVANYEGTGHGAISYYKITSANLDALMHYMLVPKTGWQNTFTDMTDVLYRSIYAPFDYIKSCKWFPVETADVTALTDIIFGNYNSQIQGRKLLTDVSYWDEYNFTLYLPPSWLSLDAKYRTSPYAHIYMTLNPWGIIELNPLDFTDSRVIKCYITPDFISGNAELRVYKVVGTTEYFITKRNAPFSVDMELTSSSIDVAGAIGGAFGAVGSVATLGTGISTTNPGQIISGIIGGASSVADIATSLVPSINGSVGTTFGGARAMDGIARLIYTSTYFAEEDNAEYGKPLCEKHVISTIPGYIKCGDGEIDIAGAMKQELDMISEHLVNGFFYE